MPSLRKKTILAPKKTFLAFPDHYVNLPAFIKFANLQGLSITDGAGKKVIAAGTIVHMKDDGEVVLPTASLAPNGIIFDEIVVDDYDSADTQVNAAVQSALLNKDSIESILEKLSKTLEDIEE